MRIQCPHCGKDADKPVGAVNRARAAGLHLYCGRECAGLARRKAKDAGAKKAEKAEYDRQYRAKNRDKRAAQKAAYHQSTYDPAKQRAYNQARMKHHVEYCRRPKYRAAKKAYDRQYRAKKFYGDFAECFLLVLAIRDECLSQQSDYEIRHAKGRVAMTQQRKREYDRSVRQEPEVGPLGNLEFRQGRQNGSLTG